MKTLKQLKIVLLTGGSSTFFIYFLLSILGLFVSQTFFGISCLGIYTLFHNMKLIVDSIKAKGSQLLYTFLMMTNIVYVFSAIYHFFYKNRFPTIELINTNIKQTTTETDCESLSKCFFSFMGTSVRSG